MNYNFLYTSWCQAEINPLYIDLYNTESMLIDIPLVFVYLFLYLDYSFRCVSFKTAVKNLPILSLLWHFIEWLSLGKCEKPLLFTGDRH